jgi:RNA recognition motif-containing protein
MTAAVTAANEGGEVKVAFKGTPLLCVMPLTEWLERKALKRSGGKKNNNTNKRALDDAENGNSQKKSKAETENADDDNEDDNEDENEVKFTKGLILKLSNVPSDATIYQVKDLFKTLGEVRFVDSDLENSATYVRLGNIEAAASVKSALEKGLPLVAGGEPLSGLILEGEEELAYWKKIDAESKLKNASGGRGSGKFKRGRGRGRGGGRGNRK